MYGQQPFYNPLMQTAQQRLQSMEAQYPQYAGTGYSSMGYTPQQGYPPSSPTPLKGRPVSNEEEANAAMIDFDGSLFVFPDKAHGRIYTKQLGLDGNIIFSRYVLESPQAPQVPVPSENTPTIDLSEYVRKGDLSQEMEKLKEKLGELEQKLQGTKEPPKKTSKGE